MLYCVLIKILFFSRNRCSGKSFDLDSVLPAVANMSADPLSNTCSPNELTLSVNPVKVSQQVNTIPSGSCESTSKDTGSNSLKLLTTRDRKRKLTDDLEFDDDEWSDKSSFNPQWLSQMRLHQNKVMPFAVIDKHKAWLELIPDPAKPTDKKSARYRGVGNLSRISIAKQHEKFMKDYQPLFQTNS